MAIAPLTGFKAFTFDGEKSTDYGVAILGEGVFNAPERDVEMITIPGRSGQFVLDNGRFENIEVTYPANLIADSEADFAEALSDFRNMLCSKRGYVRLQDNYHPDEYRMAVYKSGLEVDEKVLRAGEFEITFDCKPQRWLTSGETEVTIASSGDTITNPTLFESSPLLAAEGIGDISIGGEIINISAEAIGEITIAGSSSGGSTITLNTTNCNNGDPFTYRPRLVLRIKLTKSNATVVNPTITNSSNIASATPSIAGNVLTWNILANTIDAKIGTSDSQTMSATVPIDYTYKQGSSTISGHTSFSFTWTESYNGSTTITHQVTTSGVDSTHIDSVISSVSSDSIKADSSKLAIAQPCFIDLEIGEAYGEIGGEIISLNNSVTLPAILPGLTSGNNTITYDNTITSLEITPRWWKI